MTRTIGTVAIAVFVTVVLAGSVHTETSHNILKWQDLAGWQDDDHDRALAVFRETCRDIPGDDWRALCRLAYENPHARSYFERFFVPVLIEDGRPALFTAYFEPELIGSPVPTERFEVPLYRRPPELEGGPWFTRQEIETRGLLKDRGLEIAWLSDPVDKFFLQVQGSGRVKLTNGQIIRLGFGGKNGHPYRSVGAEMVRRGYLAAHQVSAPIIRRWVADNPGLGMDLLHHNPSYVFFRELEDVPPEKGPLGAMNRSVTAGRTIAVDPDYVPLGAPVWVEKEGSKPMRRLMVAQDTGSAIKGAQRADIFFGTGPEAGREAGRIRDPGRMVVLLPIERALGLKGARP